MTAGQSRSIDQSQTHHNQSRTAVNQSTAQQGMDLTSSFAINPINSKGPASGSHVQIYENPLLDKSSVHAHSAVNSSLKRHKDGERNQVYYQRNVH